MRFPHRVLRTPAASSPCHDRPRITANRRQQDPLACKNRPAASGSPKSAVALAAEGGTVCTGAQRTRHIASSMTDRRRFCRSSRTWQRRASVGSCSCTLERSGGHSAAVSFRQRAASPSTDVTTTRRKRSAAPFVLGGPATVGSRVRALRATVQWRVESRPVCALRRLYPRPPPGRPSKVAVLASAGRNNLSQGAAPQSGSPVGKSRPRVQTGSAAESVGRRRNRGAHPARSGNDPSAGSPTETLLRLLLPLNDQVWSSFQQTGATERPRRTSVRRPH